MNVIFFYLNIGFKLSNVINIYFFRHLNIDLLFSLQRSQHEDEIEQYYKQRFGDSSASHRFGEGEEMSDEISQQGRLPGVK